MASLDHNYITDLVSKARFGDSNAFAELYIATCQQIYTFSLHYLKDEALAKQALKDTYSLALKTLLALQDSSLFIAWLNQLCFQICYSKAKDLKKSKSADFETEFDNSIYIDSQEYVIDQILKLPFTESQVIILKFNQHLRNSEIANFLDISRSSVKRYLRSGLSRLETLSKI